MFMKRALFGAAAMAVLISQANAAFVTGGNTRSIFYDAVEDEYGVDGSISFAVFNSVGGTAGDSYGTGQLDFDSRFVASSGSDASLKGSFLYLYQMVNDGVNLEEIHRQTLKVASGIGLISYGYFTDLGFVDATGDVVAGNPLGNNGLFEENLSPQDVSGALGTNIIKEVSGLTVPNVEFSSNVFSANFLNSATLTAGTGSVIYGFTTNAPLYGFKSAGIIDGNGTNGRVAAPSLSPNDIALPTPVPGTLVLLMSMLPFGGVAAYRRRATAA